MDSRRRSAGQGGAVASEVIRGVSLSLLTMEEKGLRRRKRRNIPLKGICGRLSSKERNGWFVPGTDPDCPGLEKGTTAEEKKHLRRIVLVAARRA